MTSERKKHSHGKSLDKHKHHSSNTGKTEGKGHKHDLKTLKRESIQIELGSHTHGLLKNLSEETELKEKKPEKRHSEHKHKSHKEKSQKSHTSHKHKRHSHHRDKK